MSIQSNFATLAGKVDSSGNVPLNGAAQGVTGTLPVANGGTGATTLTSGALLKGAGTGAITTASASDIVTAIGSTAVSNATTAASCSGNAATATTAANATNADNATNATNVTGTVGAAHGGTGLTSPGTAGNVLTSTGTGWQSSTPTAATGASGDQIFFLNKQVVTANYTIPTGDNAGSFGPITINTGVTVTVPTDSTWSIV